MYEGFKKVMPAGRVITLCPTCLKQISKVSSTVHCPKAGGAAVCMSHCFETCQYMNQEMSLQRCTYNDQKRRDREGGRTHKKISLH
jgi:hypothetical protein